MKLDKVVLINWGALRDREYHMSDMTLFTGPTGSGKSTIVDAVQTVLTAVYGNLFAFNPGQDEQTQTARNGKSKRTLWSYVVGAEDNLFARPNGAHGYIAAVFSPDARDPVAARSFTAVIAAAARVDGSGERRVAVQERLNLLLVDDTQVSFADFVEGVSADGKTTTFVAVEQIEAVLRRKYKAVTNFRDGKREYLCQLYGRFRGQKTVSFPEAEAAARAIVQSIAYRPIGSVDDLVRSQVLEYDPQQLTQRISDISGLMRQVSGLRRDGERLKANVVRLDTLTAGINKATRAFEQSTVAHAAAAARAVFDDEQKLQKHDDSVKHLELSSEEEAEERRHLVKERHALSEQRVRIEATLMGTPVADQHQRFSREIAEATEQARVLARSLQQGVTAAQSLMSVARAVTGFDLPAGWGQSRRSAETVRQALDAVLDAGTDFTELSRDLGAITTGDIDVRAVLRIVAALDGLGDLLESLFAALAGAESGFNVALRNQLALLGGELAEAGRRERDLATQKESLATGGAAYPNEIAFALRTLKGELPAARAQVLCDVVEPLPGSEWQAAIEGYMGRARFNIIVAPEWEERAIALVRERHLRASVIQGESLLKQKNGRAILDESVVHELRCEHPIGRAYLESQFGAVVKVRDFETLRHTSRGVMRDGRAAGSRTMFAVDAQDLVFGMEARRLKREKVALEHQKAEQALADIRALNQSALAVANLCGRVTAVQFVSLNDLDLAARAVDRARAAIATLDLSEVQDLHAQKDAVIAQIEALEYRISDSDKRAGSSQVQAEQLRHAMQRIEGALPVKREALAARETDVSRLCELNPVLSATALLDEVSRNAAESSIEALQKQAVSLEQALNSNYHRVVQELAEYNQSAQGDERLEAVFEAPGMEGAASRYIPLVALRERVASQLSIQRDIGVVKNLDHLRVAESSFKDVFTKQFCYEIRNAVDSGVKTLQYLNRDLERLKFGTDRFILDWAEWVPEFKEFYDFFKATCELSEARESLDLFAVTELSPESLKVRDKLVALLLSDDQERAQKELQRIADYRNYRRYEVWKESDSGGRIGLSTWGTGSGGQLETPAYIVRAAVVTNRLKNFDRNMSLRLIMNDESFSKTDERRARDIIRFLRDNLGMQLLCAMPTKHAGAIKTEFTKEYSITRLYSPGHGETNLVSDADERDLRTDSLRSLWDRRRQQVREQAQIAFDAEEQQG